MPACLPLQDEAIEAVADAVVRSRAGLATQERPVGSFLFLGPTGVGKTETAKALAAELFDDEVHTSCKALFFCCASTAVLI
eukprot:SAG22_NODE_263_length_13359_cov_3.396531_5_plen_81_part_00